MRNLLRWLVDRAFGFPIGLTIRVLGGLWNSLWDGRWFIEDVRNGVFGWLESARSFWPWNWLPGFDRIIGVLQSFLNDLFQWPLRIIEIFINWLRDQTSDWTGQWEVLDALVNARDRGREIADAVGGWIDSLIADPLGTLTSLAGAVADALRSWIEALIAQLREWALAAMAVIVDWVNSIPSPIRDWIEAAGQWLLDVVNALLAQLREWALAAIDFALDPIRSWISQWQLVLEWVQGVAANLQAFLDEPLEWLWARWELTLWPKLESWLLKVWDGDA